MDIVNWIPFNRVLEIMQCFKEVKFPKGSDIISQDQEGNEFYVIKEGVCRVFSDDKDPATSFSKLYYQGDYFGESVLFGQTRRLANVAAVTDVTLLQITSQDFWWIFDYHPPVITKSISPMLMIRNLSEMRRSKQAEFVNANKTLARMSESQKSLLNMCLSPR